METMFSYSEVQRIIAEVEYELLDGAGMAYHKRTFTTEEYETIKGVIDRTYKMLDFFKARKERKA